LCFALLLLAVSAEIGAQRSNTKRRTTARKTSATTLRAPTEAECKLDIDYCFNRYCYDKKTVENGMYARCGGISASNIVINVEDCLATRAEIKQINLKDGCKPYTYDYSVQLLSGKEVVEAQLKRNSNACNAMTIMLDAAKACHAAAVAHDGSIDPAFRTALSGLCGKSSGGSDEMIDRFYHAGDYGDANIGAQRDMALSDQNTAKRGNWRQVVDGVLAGYAEIAELSCGAEDFSLTKINLYSPDSRENLEMARLREQSEQTGRQAANRVVNHWFAEADCVNAPLPEGGSFWSYEEGGYPDCRIVCEQGYKVVGSTSCEKEEDYSAAGAAFMGINIGPGFDWSIKNPEPQKRDELIYIGGGYTGGGGYEQGGGGYNDYPSIRTEPQITIKSNDYPLDEPVPIPVQPAAPAAGSSSRGGSTATTAGCTPNNPQKSNWAAKTCTNGGCTPEELCAMVFGSPANYERAVVGNYGGIACFGTGTLARSTIDSWYMVQYSTDRPKSFHHEIKNAFPSYVIGNVATATTFLRTNCPAVLPPASERRCPEHQHPSNDGMNGCVCDEGYEQDGSVTLENETWRQNPYGICVKKAEYADWCVAAGGRWVGVSASSICQCIENGKTIREGGNCNSAGYLEWCPTVTDQWLASNISINMRVQPESQQYYFTDGFIRLYNSISAGLCRNEYGDLQREHEKVKTSTYGSGNQNLLNRIIDNFKTFRSCACRENSAPNWCSTATDSYLSSNIDVNIRRQPTSNQRYFSNDFLTTYRLINVYSANQACLSRHGDLRNSYNGITNLINNNKYPTTVDLSRLVNSFKAYRDCECR
jgi:hypothetical protein